MTEFKIDDRTFRVLEPSYNNCETIFGMLMNGIMTLPAMANKEITDIGSELQKNPGLFLGAFMNAVFGDVERRTQLIESLLQEHDGSKWRAIRRTQLDNHEPDSQLPPQAVNHLFRGLIESDGVRDFLTGRLGLTDTLGRGLNTGGQN